MVPKAEQMQVKTLLAETVTLLCKNGLKFSKELRIEALIGITIDNDEVVLINLNETLQQNVVVPEVASKQKGKVMLVGKSHLHKSKVRQSADSELSTSTASSSCQAAQSATYLKDIAEPVRKKRKQSGTAVSHQKAGIKHELAHDIDGNHQDEAVRTTAQSQNDDETDSDDNKLKMGTFIQDFVGFDDDGDDTCDDGDDMTGSVSILEGHSGEGQQQRSSGNSRVSRVQKHVRRLQAANSFVCNQCGKSFRSGGLLRSHVAVIHEKVFLTCNLCGHGLRTFYLLRCHMASRHKQKKEYVCPTCSREFSYKHTLKQHFALMHIGEELPASALLPLN